MSGQLTLYCNRLTVQQEMRQTDNVIKFSVTSTITTPLRGGRGLVYLDLLLCYLVFDVCYEQECDLIWQNFLQGS